MLWRETHDEERGISVTAHRAIFSPWLSAGTFVLYKELVRTPSERHTTAEQSEVIVEGAKLVVISPLKAVLRPNGKILLTRKFVDGMVLYRELWKGPVVLVCEPGTMVSDNLDNMEFDPDAQPFQTICAEITQNRLRELLTPNSIVLTSAGGKFNDISQICCEMGVPCVYITEYSLLTRLQIAKQSRRSILRRAGHWWRATREERSVIRALRIANGVQCNGTPTYMAYKALTPLPHLFFDSRVDQDMLATGAEVSARLAHMKRHGILRLVFSGRLNLMKGVHHLPLVADRLRHLGVPFEMSICGDGEYICELRRHVASLNLGDKVSIRGALDFKTELLPFVKKETDLFVCCHPQGDPSCTYLETMACGVPIIGYSNEALEGIVQLSGAGWTIAVWQPKDLAERIATIYRDLTALEVAAQRSLAFAREHSFGTTFSGRIDHLNLVYRRARSS